MVAEPSDSPLPRSSLRERIKDVMLQRIVAGEYAPGARLVETRIAQELRVSQASVREALRDLEHIGCVVLRALPRLQRAQRSRSTSCSRRSRSAPRWSRSPPSWRPRR